MKYIEFNGFSLSRIVFGGASISSDGAGYGFGLISENDALELIKYAISKGINNFDTAPIYGYGKSEQTLGVALKQIREKVFITSKAGVDWHESKRVNMTNEPKIISRMFDESRKRLQTDYIDLYMIHWPDKNTDIRYALEPLYKLKEKGYIKHLGLCNTNTHDLALAQQIEFIQSQFNYFHNGFENIERKKYFTMGWGTFDKGILAGSVSQQRKFDSFDCRSWAAWWKKSDWKDRVLKADDLANKIAPMSLSHFSLDYALKSIDFPIIGAKSKKHIDDICEFFK
ncbi:MAG: aldo/keto reductase [Bacteriovoracaceae bacterium]|jgi:aryl-alcohol dehydrogenase-like predicted oxidoreductase|nr:aldo/keto reductase [Bacteriovoracaceae bacterium]